ncbi:MAG: ABC transporter permease subunit [Acidimicrobiaceae bacterium]|nr:ABC transporter permease subunit [Acidimicrobiaceae bacterium]
MRSGTVRPAPPVHFRLWARISLAIPVLIVSCFIYVPILLILLLSFQGPQGGATFPIRDPGTLWYRSLADLSVITEHPDYLGQAVFDFKASIVNSLKLAIATACISTVVAMAAAQAMRSRFRGARLATYAILLGIVTPGLAVSLGIVTISSELGITAGLFTTGIVAHVAWTMPFSFLLFMVLFNRFDRQIEEAAYTLGASRLETFFTVTVPIMKPAVIGSCLFAFMLSFDEYAHSIFIMGADRTLPLMLVSAAQLRITPSIFALGVLIISISLVLLLAYVANVRRTFRRQERGGA